MKYRTDIDGLRAVAVVPVVLYHAGLSAFSGGFVGVDVFFVISGFLITGLIAGEMRDGTFSVARFYERRVRRIFPALFTMMAVTFVIASLIYIPSDFARLGRSMLATALFGSNILFASESGYFAASSEIKPLLHTWSLAVEEQFYIVFPLLMLLLLRGTERVFKIVLAGLFCVSLAASIWALGEDPDDAFYLAQFRAWELLTGALLALGVVPLIRDGRLREILAAAGLAMIAWSVFAYDAATPFPGIGAILPVLGTALLLHAGTLPADTDTPGDMPMVARLLSLKPLVAIGLISYSLYLWHWPAMVLSKYAANRPLEGIEMSAVIALSVALAWLSWRFVERPFRGRGAWFTQSQILTGGAVTMAAMIAVGGTAYQLDGVPQRLSAGAVAFADASKDINPRQAECHHIKPWRVAKDDFCRIGPADGPARVMIWGDSHADALQPAFEQLAVDTATPGYIVTYSACPPLLGAWPVSDHRQRCRQFNDEMLKAVDRHGVKVVVLAARWGVYTVGFLPHEGSRHPYLISDAQPDPSAENAQKVLEAGLENLLQELKSRGVTVWLVGQVPLPHRNVPRSLAIAETLGSGFDALSTTRDQQTARFGEMNNFFGRMAKTYNVRLLDPTLQFCGPEKCRLQRDGRSLYSDDDHVSGFGATTLKAMLAPIFTTALPKHRELTPVATSAIP